MVKIIYPKSVNLYFKELIKILYQKGYFGYHESAREYVLSLRKEIEATIHIRRRRKASSYFSRYGKNLWYVSYPRSKHTTWYFFFTQHENDIYVIRYITNNHVEGHFIE